MLKVNVVVHSMNKRKKKNQESAQKDGFDYRLLKWFFVVLLCKVDNRPYYASENHAIHTVRALY